MVEVPDVRVPVVPLPPGVLLLAPEPLGEAAPVPPPPAPEPVIGDEVVDGPEPPDELLLLAGSQPTLKAASAAKATIDRRTFIASHLYLESRNSLRP